MRMELTTEINHLPVISVVNMIESSWTFRNDDEMAAAVAHVTPIAKLEPTIALKNIPANQTTDQQKSRTRKEKGGQGKLHR